VGGTRTHSAIGKRGALALLRLGVDEKDWVEFLNFIATSPSQGNINR
jgi:hypothetical protein